jgi:hypothetical protein
VARRWGWHPVLYCRRRRRRLHTNKCTADH